MKKIIIFISALIIILIVFLVYRIYINISGKNTSTTAIIAPLEMGDFIFPVNSDFKYYDTLKPSISSKEERFWDHTFAHYTFNQDGLNERYNYNTFKPEGVFRIVVLGDSFTFGHFVDTEDNWTERLEDLLNENNSCQKIKKFEVINLGMRGFDIPYIVKRYNDFGLKYHPNMIIWFESGSGFSRNNELMQPYIKECKSKSETESGVTKTPKEFYKCWEDASTKMYQENSQETIEKDLDLWSSKFFDIRNLTPTLFATFKKIDKNQKDKMQDRIKDQTNTFLMTGISNLALKNGLFPDSYPNIKGHTVVAREIYDYLVKNKALLQCD